jgi:hypothetical protein
VIRMTCIKYTPCLCPPDHRKEAEKTKYTLTYSGKKLPTETETDYFA